MAQEIERKFLLAGDGWRGLAVGVEYRQGYLCAAKERSVRVRIAGDRGYLTVKGATVGASRSEYEYEIPLTDARAMLKISARSHRSKKNAMPFPTRGLSGRSTNFLASIRG